MYAMWLDQTLYTYMPTSDYRGGTHNLQNALLIVMSDIGI